MPAIPATLKIPILNADVPVEGSEVVVGTEVWF